ncbi:hypothetical protein FNV43_RR06089 [Rhamnella rubrinervis]|uniref:LRAT domain-containing protein n=1 Tax=Rhamnella rubrinervis TaxID=2594499 RepID=A0A8K0HCX7_9ROSA|nr:hypothetical protein FNV43_RR06089 [Rhamnella rubrinervis]
MGLLSNKIRVEQLNCGDHIYTWRKGYTYSHHGLLLLLRFRIYVGDGKVIHLTRAPGFIMFSSSVSDPSTHDPVECCSIQNFLCGGQLYRYEYGVSLVVVVIKRPGTCTSASSNSPESVLHRANFLLNLKHGFGGYDLFDKNCEDFAIYCKTGFLKIDDYPSGRSAQMTSLLAAFLAVVVSPYPFLPSFIAQTLIICAIYCLFRVFMDVGVSTSRCVVVAVEELADRQYLSYQHKVVHEILPSWLHSVGEYSVHVIWAISYWLWIPESRIAICLRGKSFPDAQGPLHLFGNPRVVPFCRTVRE